MDREKLVDACDTAFLENYFPSSTESPDSRWDMFADGFKQGAQWHESLPLSERLTEAEKENIMQVYRRASYPSNRATYTGRTVLRLFPSIFGTDLFKEK